jgi:hypothetical protein
MKLTLRVALFVLICCPLLTPPHLQAGDSPLFAVDFTKEKKLDDSVWQINAPGQDFADSSITWIDGTIRLRVYGLNRKCKVFLATKNYYDLKNGKRISIEMKFKVIPNEPGSGKSRWTGRPIIGVASKKNWLAAFQLRYNSYETTGTLRSFARKEKWSEQHTRPGIPIGKWLTLKMVVGQTDAECHLTDENGAALDVWRLEYEKSENIRPLFYIRSNGKWPPASLHLESIKVEYVEKNGKASNSK